MRTDWPMWPNSCAARMKAAISTASWAFRETRTSTPFWRCCRATPTIFTQAASERALPVSELAARAAAAGLDGEAVATVPEAVTRAKALAAPADTIFIGGSTFVVAEVL